MKNNLFETTAKLFPFLLGTQGKNRFSILIYHRVLPKLDELFPNEVTKEVFDWQMEIIARYFNPLPLSEALLLMDENKLPERAVCVTFDDGYADNETMALPILSKWKIPATVFIASGYLNGGRMWNDTVIECIRAAKGQHLDLQALGLGEFILETVADQRQAIGSIIGDIKYLDQERRQSAVETIQSQVACPLPDNLMMTNEQVIQLHRNGISIGAHTLTHPILAQLKKEQVILEVEKNKFDLEKITGESIRYFAYPNGKLGQDYIPEQRDLIRELGFQAACATQWGVAGLHSDRWQLPRFTPWDKKPYQFMNRLIVNYRKIN